MIDGKPVVTPVVMRVVTRVVTRVVLKFRKISGPGSCPPGPLVLV